MSVLKESSGMVGRMVIIFAFAWLGLTMDLRSQTNEAPKILFLHLQLKGQLVALVKASVRPGHVKPRPNSEFEHGIQFVITDSEGHSLWEGTMEDPRSRSIEHEDATQSGKLKRKKVELHDPEFMVRVPVMTTAKHIEFYEVESRGSEGNAKRRPLGKLLLPAP